MRCSPRASPCTPLPAGWHGAAAATAAARVARLPCTAASNRDSSHTRSTPAMRSCLQGAAQHSTVRAKPPSFLSPLVLPGGLPAQPLLANTPSHLMLPSLLASRLACLQTLSPAVPLPACARVLWHHACSAFSHPACLPACLPCVAPPQVERREQQLAAASAEKETLQAELAAAQRAAEEATYNAAQQGTKQVGWCRVCAVAYCLRGSAAANSALPHCGARQGMPPNRVFLCDHFTHCLLACVPTQAHQPSAQPGSASNQHCNPRPPSHGPPPPPPPPPHPAHPRPAGQQQRRCRQHAR